MAILGEGDDAMETQGLIVLTQTRDTVKGQMRARTAQM